jgi:hypothetical protein
MIFTTHRRLTKSAETPLPYTATPVQTFSQQYRTFTAAQQMQRSAIVATSDATMNPVPPPPPEKKKGMKWAQPTWFLFHTLAEKIREDSFPIIRTELLNIIYTICCNLPCPDCAKHARAYMDGVNFDAIQTREHLRIMLHRFHNEVNKRKGYPQFPYEEVGPKYSAANTVNIIHYFMPFFEDKHASLRMIADDLHRARIAVQMKAWFNKNIGYFNL